MQTIYAGTKGMVDSMTKKERADPDIIDLSRRRRIAEGSGTEPHEVKQFLFQFDQARTLMRQMASMSILDRLKMVTGMGKAGMFNPGSMMPKFEAALKNFAKAPGVILDLRGNPGGIGIMAMGIAGFFIDKNGLKLGDMKMRDATLKFVIFPRPETYGGPLAILVDGGSASTSEILAGGLQDLKRARIFGTRTAGAALPSDIIRLPNGDGFQYPQAIYTSVSGKVLEGAGVTPDVIVPQSYGPDAVIEAADDWIRSTLR